MSSALYSRLVPIMLAFDSWRPPGVALLEGARGSCRAEARRHSRWPFRIAPFRRKFAGDAGLSSANEEAGEKGANIFGLVSFVERRTRSPDEHSLDDVSDPRRATGGTAAAVGALPFIQTGSPV